MSLLFPLILCALFSAVISSHAQEINVTEFCTKGNTLKNGTACFIAGRQLEGGGDLERNAPLALKLLDRGCRLGQFEACHHAAILISSGNELGNDIKRASHYFTKACNNGLKNSCYSAGHLNVLLEQYDIAFPILFKICEQEQNGAACRMAGLSVLELHGPTASRIWYEKGCDARDQKSCDYIKGLNRYEAEQDEYDRLYIGPMAKRDAGVTQVTDAINAGDYNRAMEIATYGHGDPAQAARVVIEADGADKLVQIDPFYYSFLERWFAIDYPQAHAIIGAIIRREPLKKPHSERPSAISNRDAAAISTIPKATSLYDEPFWKNQKDSYKRQLDRANRDGYTTAFKVDKIIDP